MALCPGCGKKYSECDCAPSEEMIKLYAKQPKHDQAERLADGTWVLAMATILNGMDNMYPQPAQATMLMNHMANLIKKELER